MSEGNEFVFIKNSHLAHESLQVHALRRSHSEEVAAVHFYVSSVHACTINTLLISCKTINNCLSVEVLPIQLGAIFGSTLKRFVDMLV